MSRSRVAVVLFNLGGPDGPEAVEPFLRNLFSDPAIIDLPGFIRRPLAGLIATVIVALNLKLLFDFATGG